MPGRNALLALFESMTLPGTPRGRLVGLSSVSECHLPDLKRGGGDDRHAGVWEIGNTRTRDCVT